MSWTYRVVKRMFSNGGHPDVQEPVFAIHEAYDDGDITKPHTISRNPIHPQGETLEELHNDFKMMQKAFQQPALNWEDFPPDVSDATVPADKTDAI